ncbi:unnamed protein product [Ilex paraguariensis]|uniref:Uncharacterized protein n=1 Tax=Ilex paraguariensis TaxID=185542 RepID=A0ABC8RIB2_9AQUA
MLVISLALKLIGTAVCETQCLLQHINPPLLVCLYLVMDLSCSTRRFSARLTHDITTNCRGNAVMRSTAKKQTAQDIIVSMPSDVNVHVGLDDMPKLPTRTIKSRTATMVIRRLIWTFRVLTVIAAVNVPLYMMLLFKDWIDK